MSRSDMRSWENRINTCCKKIIDNRITYGSVLRVERANGEILFDGAAGNLSGSSRYFIASTTKLYVTSLIMKLVAKGSLVLRDSLDKFFSSELLFGLNVYRGVDCSGKITVKQLLEQTSGIPDYFSGRGKRGCWRR